MKILFYESQKGHTYVQQVFNSKFVFLHCHTGHKSGKGNF